MRLLAAIAMASIAWIQPATADRFKLVVDGTVRDITSFNDSFGEVRRETSFHVGDLFSSTYVFDTANYEVLDIPEPDETSTIYLGTVDALQVSIGSFSLSYNAVENVASSIAVWNNLNLDYPTDFFGITANYYSESSISPVAFGNSGPYSFSTYFNAFDLSGLARSTDVITEITPLDGFDRQAVAAEFRDSGNLATTVGINIASARIFALSAVPEPATWAMMLVGFGLMGGALRYGRKRTTVAYA